MRFAVGRPPFSRRVARRAGMTSEPGIRAPDGPDPRAGDRPRRDLAGKLPGAAVRYILAPDGHDRIDVVGGCCKATLGLDAASLGHDPAPLWAQVVPEDLRGMQASIRDSARNLTPWLHRWRVVAPDGRRKWLEGQGNPVRLPDGATRWDSLILDVTELEALCAEFARVRADLRTLRTRLDRFGQAKTPGALAAALAHEIRQPLAALANYLGTAGRLLRASGPGPAPVRDLVDRAEAQADRAAGIVARIEALFTTGEIRAEPADLNDVVAEAVGIALEAAGPPVTVTRAFAPGLPPLPLDRLLIQQLIDNLLRNARAALAGHADPRLAIRTEAAARGARIVVEDNGPGVPEALRDRLFDPFVQGAEQGGGLGIGLAISASVVAAHGGTIAFAPVPTGGARFTVTLPAAR